MAEYRARLRSLTLSASGCGVVAGAEGLELSTSGFGDRRSSQLSYTPNVVRLVNHRR
ncbi:hypothetical protein AA0323_0791 [Asaia siamensis NRIC 0323]|nr:hypothetical protein AA0323_0791 [Asaia siamensis NRIC 0323]